MNKQSKLQLTKVARKSITRSNKFILADWIIDSEQLIGRLQLLSFKLWRVSIWKVIFYVWQSIKQGNFSKILQIIIQDY
jgi:hypothetical protein